MIRTEICHGERLAQIRSDRGLTQIELAAMAGCSERLIRKAESGQLISVSAINDLASVLSLDDKVIHPEDLICNPKQLTEQFFNAFNEFESEMAAQVAHFIAEDFTLLCAGDPLKIPFAGEWKGIKGLDQWAHCFFETFTRPDRYFFKPEFIVSQDTVVAWGQDLCHAPGMPPIPPFWLTLKLRFSKGKLLRYEALFDTEKGSKHLAQARAQALMDE